MKVCKIELPIAYVNLIDAALKYAKEQGLYKGTRMLSLCKVVSKTSKSRSSNRCKNLTKMVSS